MAVGLLVQVQYTSHKNINMALFTRIYCPVLQIPTQVFQSIPKMIIHGLNTVNCCTTLQTPKSNSNHSKRELLMSLRNQLKVREAETKPE